MRIEDPLETWLMWSQLAMDPAYVEQVQADCQASLDQLGDLLDHPTAKGVDFSNVRLWSRGEIGLAPQDLHRAQDLYFRVFETGGSASVYLQRSLLHRIAATEDPVSIPFWLKLLGLSRPRERFRKERRLLALAALARLAIQRDEPLAYRTLRDLTGHRDDDIRALAVRYLGSAYLYPERPIGPEVLSDVVTIAADDVGFLARFQARAVLRAVGHPIPLDNPKGAYAFKVKFSWNKRIYRIIELRSEQTLDDLHFAIQRAIGWDADHLYSFFMNGERFNDDYAFSCPYEEERPPWTDEAIIGELGLTMKHKFLYYFDYGDGHKFEVEVADVRSTAEPGEYPRVVESRGEAPPQYGWRDDE